MNRMAAMIRWAIETAKLMSLAAARSGADFGDTHTYFSADPEKRDRQRGALWARAASDLRDHGIAAPCGVAEGTFILAYSRRYAAVSQHRGLLRIAEVIDRLRPSMLDLLAFNDLESMSEDAEMVEEATYFLQAVAGYNFPEIARLCSEQEGLQLVASETLGVTDAELELMTSLCSDEWDDLVYRSERFGRFDPSRYSRTA